MGGSIPLLRGSKWEKVYSVRSAPNYFGILFAESVCSQLKDDIVDFWQISDNRDRFMRCPRDGIMVIRTWYEARNKCLLLGGDLVTSKVTTPNLVNVLDKHKKYWIGMQRDSLVMTQGTLY